MYQYNIIDAPQINSADDIGINEEFLGTRGKKGFEGGVFNFGTHAFCCENQPQSVKFLSYGILQGFNKGLTYYCYSIPEKMDKSMSRGMGTVLRYGAFQNAGIAGALIAGAVTGAASMLKNKATGTKPMTDIEIRDTCDFFIPFANIISLQSLEIPKGGMFNKQIPILKIKTKLIDGSIINYWLEEYTKGNESLIEAINKQLVDLHQNTKPAVTDSAGTISDIDIPGQLKKYAELKDSGVITDEEFQLKKKQLLNL